MTRVNVYFNGALVGHTDETKHGAAIEWNSHKNAPLSAASASASDLITLVLPRGQLLSSCRLEIEVVASVHHTSMMNATTTTSTVLGARLITGEELCALVGIVPKLHSTVSSASNKTSRKAIAPLHGGAETFVALEESTRIHNSTTFTQAAATSAVSAAAPAVPAVPAPSTSTKVANTSQKKRGVVLDAAGMAQANEMAAALALPSTLTPQGEVSLALKRGVYGGDSGVSVVNSGTGRVKDIVIEEPELVRENSLLLLNVKNLQGLQAAIAAAKQSASATTHAAHGGAVDVSASKKTEIIDVSIKWNGILVDTFFAVLDTVTQVITWPQEPSVVLRLPLNLTVQDCHLEVLFSYEQTHLGGVTLYGDLLNTLAGVSINNTNPDEGEDKKDAAAPATAVTTVGMPCWRTLSPSPAIPVSLHSPVIEGRCLLQATLTIPVVTKTTSVKTFHRTRKLYPVIHTELPSEKEHWEYLFEQEEDEPERAADNDQFALNGDTPVITKRRDSRPSPALQYRKRLMSDISRNTDHSGDDSSVHNHNNAPKTTTNPTAPNANNPHNLNNAQTAGLMGTRSKNQKLQLELSAIGFTVTVHQEIDEYRTCWRGRVLPKNFTGSEATRKALMVSRASRLVRTHGISDMQVSPSV